MVYLVIYLYTWISQWECFVVSKGKEGNVFPLTLCISHKSPIEPSGIVGEIPFWHNMCNS